jgi:hypothetical protein
MAVGGCIAYDITYRTGAGEMGIPLVDLRVVKGDGGYDWGLLGQVGSTGRTTGGREAAMNRTLTMVLTVTLALCLWTGGAALAAGTWADEIVTAATFYKSNYPTGNWDPYFKELAKVKEGIGRGDAQIVKVEMDRFLKMLLRRAHGITDIAADELCNFALGAMPSEPSISAMPFDLEAGTEKPISVPDHTIKAPYEGGRACRLEGCDYWLDNVFDPGG